MSKFDSFYSIKNSALSALLCLSFSALADVHSMNNFENDVKRLERHFSPIILADGSRKIAILAELQGRIMVATANGEDGASIGWMKRAALDGSIQPDGSLGGINRLWFGPDGGALSVFFEPNAETTTDNIRVPAAVDSLPFDVVKSNKTQANFKQTVTFNNHSGFEFRAQVERTVSLFDETEVSRVLGTDIPSKVDWVGYGSSTKITNIDRVAWSSETGQFSIWNLGMFEPPAVVVIPLKRPIEQATAYFEDTSRQRQLVTDKTLFYYADAKEMDKVGIPPNSTSPFIGSYNAQKKMLTVVSFTVDEDPNARYVNAVWDWDAPPYQGEIINIFNDGPQLSGAPLGRFYEMESSSRALNLYPGESETHVHNTYHFIGKAEQLSNLSNALFGLSISQIEGTFSTQLKTN